MFKTAKEYRQKFKKGHGEYEFMLASIRGFRVRIEIYHRDDGRNIRTIVVLVDYRDRKRLPFDQQSRVEGYIGSKEAKFWFVEYCKRYGINSRRIEKVRNKLWEDE